MGARNKLLLRAGALHAGRYREGADSDIVSESESSADDAASVESLPPTQRADSAEESTEQRRQPKRPRSRATTTQSKRVRNGDGHRAVPKMNDVSDSETEDEDEAMEENTSVFVDSDAERDSIGDGDSASDSSGDSDSDDTAPVAQQTRKRGMWQERREMIDNHPEIATQIPSLAPQVFTTQKELETVWAQYMAETLTSYRTRDSMTLAGYKKKLANANTKDMEKYRKQKQLEDKSRVARSKAKAAGVAKRKLPPIVLAGKRPEPRVPADFPEDTKPRAKVRFTGCAARVTLQKIPVVLACGNTAWRIVVTNENTVHNHNISPTIFACYLKSLEVADELLLGTIDVLASTNTQTKQISSYVSGTLGFDVSSQTIRNILAARLGGANAEARMKKIVADFLVGDGNHCAFIRDHKKMTAGITIQSGTQAAVFEYWPETVVLDWTYNTNNLGFNLGSLICTGATGRGLPVYEFLSVTESKVALTRILNYFKSTNPGWEKIEAFTIDKDFTEIVVLKALFPNAVIFLCFFHALRAVSRAVTQKKHGLAPHICLNIEARFAELMFCSTESSYKLYLELFRLYVGEVSSDVLAYFEDNWFPIYLTWTNVGRAQAFSCGNTTTNRVETNWTQVKSVIGNKTGIDKCVSALLQHQLTIFRGLATKLSKHTVGSRMLVGIPKFLYPISVLLSDFALEKVLNQWTYYLAHKSEWRIDAIRTPLNADAPAPLAWEKKQRPTRFHCTTPNGVYTVDTQRWTCTCFFYVSMRLPCQHMVIVTEQGRKKRVMPIHALHDRWNMVKAQALLPSLTAGATFLSKLRYNTSGLGSGHDSSENLTAAAEANQPKIRYIQLSGRRKAKRIVLSRLEKRNVVRVETERVMHKLEQYGTTKFYARYEEMREMFDALLTRWDVADKETEASDGVSPAASWQVNERDVSLDESPIQSQLDGSVDEFDATRFMRHDDTERVPDDEEVRCVLTNMVDLVELHWEMAQNPLRSSNSGDPLAENADGVELSRGNGSMDGGNMDGSSMDVGDMNSECESDQTMELEYATDDKMYDTDVETTSATAATLVDDEPMHGPDHSVLDGHARTVDSAEQHHHTGMPDEFRGLQDVSTEHMLSVSTSQLTSQLWFDGMQLFPPSPLPASEAELCSGAMEVPSKLFPVKKGSTDPMKATMAAADQVLTNSDELSELFDSSAPAPSPPKTIPKKVVEKPSRDSKKKKITGGRAPSTIGNTTKGSEYSSKMKPARDAKSNDARNTSEYDGSETESETMSTKARSTQGEDWQSLAARPAAGKAPKYKWPQSTVKPPTNHGKANGKRKAKTKVLSDSDDSSSGHRPDGKVSVKRGLALLDLPVPAKGNQRKQPRSRPSKLGILGSLQEDRELSDIRIDEFVNWAYHWKDLHTVIKTLRVYKEIPASRERPKAMCKVFTSPYGMHPFVIPDKAANNLLKAIHIQKEQDRTEGKDIEDDLLSNAPGKRELYAGRYPHKDSLIYSEPFLLAVRKFYRIKELATRWAEDWTWVKRLAPKTGGPFDDFFHQHGIGSLRTPLAELAANVKIQFSNTKISQRYLCKRLITGETLDAYFEGVIGCMANERYISGNLLMFLFNFVFASSNKKHPPRSDVFIFDPIITDRTEFKPPPVDPTSLKYILQPYLIDGNHWTLIAISFVTTPPTVLFYEPTVMYDRIETMKFAWRDFTKPLVESWMERYHPGSQLDDAKALYMNKPVQRDGHSCGFLCLVFAYHLVHGLYTPYEFLKNLAYQPKDLVTLRMKCLHLIICDADQEQEPDDENLVRVAMQIVTYWQGKPAVVV